MRRRLRLRIIHRTGRGRALELLASACIGLLLASACIHWINGALRPQMLALAEASISQQITEISTCAIREAMVQNEERSLLKMEKLQNSGASILNLNPILINEIRSSVLDDINGKINSLEKGRLDIPLGSVTGLDLLSGLGPGVPLHVLSVSAVSADFHSEFLAAGINQTLYRLILQVEVQTRLLLPGYRAKLIVSTPICVAESIIIGEVPDLWTPAQ